MRRLDLGRLYDRQRDRQLLSSCAGTCSTRLIKDDDAIVLDCSSIERGRAELCSLRRAIPTDVQHMAHAWHVEQHHSSP